MVTVLDLLCTAFGIFWLWFWTLTIVNKPAIYGSSHISLYLFEKYMWQHCHIYHFNHTFDTKHFGKHVRQVFKLHMFAYAYVGLHAVCVGDQSSNLYKEECHLFTIYFYQIQYECWFIATLELCGSISILNASHTQQNILRSFMKSWFMNHILST